VLVTDEPHKYPADIDFPKGMTIHHRDELDKIQRMLAEIPGATAMIYDQTCAAEKRRRRKRGEFPDPDKRVIINELVCEGCGDCGVQSNCVSVQPVETEWGRKRTIDQTSCNKDFSCVKGFCPSFVTVSGEAEEGGGRCRRDGRAGYAVRTAASASQRHVRRRHYRHRRHRHRHNCPGTGYGGSH
jgi:indolepyruvate ferredoxin oxidoreductase